ncbi:MAG: glutathione peroxidase [Bacteriovoracaceae bacterium]|nr:glutathione peroxidase [Bacteriovoracaceae bacterium]
MSTIHDFKVKSIAGTDVDLSQWKGKWMVIVNVASKCGFTPQYSGLESLYRSMKNNVVVLGFPCNQFGAQEPGNADEIQNFCSLTYQVSFPMMGKIDVNGDKADPVYKFLKGEKPGLLGSEAIKWNFTKFLVNPQGEVVKRYAPTDSPEKIQADIQAQL